MRRTSSSAIEVHRAGGAQALGGFGGGLVPGGEVSGAARRPGMARDQVTMMRLAAFARLGSRMVELAM
ncbi:MAG: hypothetical protein U1F68_15605 [Gammaproteobacteria bacterium]